SEVAIVEIPLARDSSRLPTADVENILFEVGASRAFGENPVHFICGECATPDSKIIQSAVYSGGSPAGIGARAVLADVESQTVRSGHVIAVGSQRLDIDNRAVEIGGRIPGALEGDANMVPNAVGQCTRSPVIAFRGAGRPSQIPAQAAIAAGGDSPTLTVRAGPVFVGNERKLARRI